MKLHLAPMEGVVDFVLRDLLTGIGGIDQCVTEFIRVTSQLIPAKVIYHYCAELKSEGKTASGVPVLVQILGSDPQVMAENAAQIASLGAVGIDINFGCPAKTVNRHDGGAVLLKNPDRVFKVVEAVRKAVPKNIPVSGKIRLGFDQAEICVKNAEAVQAGGAQKLTVHCRTKMDMYKPPAYWHWIAKIKEVVSLPIIANGDIWGEAELLECKKVTGCNEFMIGRGALRDPFVFRRLKGLQVKQSHKDLLLPFFQMNSQRVSPSFAQARTKQLLRNFIGYDETYLRYFDDLKVITLPSDFAQRLSEL
jgi:tRNA-dihydrouridine synthase C